MLKFCNRLLFLCVVLFTFVVFNLATDLCAQFSSPEQDVELTRRENAVSEKIQSQLEELLGNYYKKESFVIDVKSKLERIPVREKSPKAKKVEKEEKEEIELPGLPVVLPPEIVDEGDEKEKFDIDQWIFSDKIRIKYLEISILLDEKIFLNKDEDLDFIKMVSRARAKLDESRGDSLIIKAIPFPQPIETLNTTAVKESTEPTKLKESKNPLLTLRPYLLYGCIVLMLLLIAIVLLQVINISKMKKVLQDVFLQLGLPQASKTQTDKIQLSEKQSQKIPVVNKLETLNGQKNGQKIFFNELKQFVVNAIIGNPQLASEIFKKWVDTNKDDGVHQFAELLKATDPQLVKMLSEYITDQNIISSVEHTINQDVPIDEKVVVEIFKRFRESFREKETSKSAKTKFNEEESMFQFLKQITPEQIFHIIKDEPVTIIAIVLAQLSPEVANSLLVGLPIEKQSRIPVEMAKLKKVPISAYREIADKLAKKALEVEKIKYVATDGVEALINMLEQSSPEKEQEILTSILEYDIMIAKELRKIYITFEEICKLPDRFLSELFREFNRDVVIKALVGSSMKIREKVLNNLPPRIKIVVADELKIIEESGEVQTEEIQKAQKTITQKIRELAKTGKIDLKKLMS
ncbi:MAG: FliG C-terminal domain-containing protein [Elusimicrobiota bacterium]